VELKIRRRSDQWSYIRKWLTTYVHGLEKNEEHDLRVTENTSLQRIEENLGHGRRPCIASL